MLGHWELQAPWCWCQPGLPRLGTGTSPGSDRELCWATQSHLAEQNPQPQPLLGLFPCPARPSVVTEPFLFAQPSCSDGRADSQSLWSPSEARAAVPSPQLAEQNPSAQTMHHWLCQVELAGRLVTLGSGSELAAPVLSCHSSWLSLPSPPLQPWEISSGSTQIIQVMK